MTDFQLSQLNQFLGQQKYEAADAVLRAFVPKRTGVSEARAAAIWTLGLFHEGKADAALTPALEARLNDTTSIPPEDFRVRRMCAVTLGRMKAREALPSLRKFYPAGQPSEDMVNNACGWAVEQITGEVMPPPRTIEKAQRDWFLSPLD
jgi:hypothetical protein